MPVSTFLLPDLLTACIRASLTEMIWLKPHLSASLPGYGGAVDSFSEQKCSLKKHNALLPH